MGFKGEIIHIYNKNENAIHDSDYFENLEHRENIILMGDSLGDLHMADGATDSAQILKIGFLNDKVSLIIIVIAPITNLTVSFHRWKRDSKHTRTPSMSSW